MTEFVETLTDPIPFWTKAWRDHLARNPGVSGATSLALLKEHAREKLGKVDRERLALGLHAESVRLGGAPALRRAFSNAEWMRAAQLADEPANPTKRLSAYLLRPYGEVSPDRWDPDIWELRASKVSASARNFALLIDALSEFTIEEHEQVCRRIFAGTSFAATAADNARHERLAARLDTLVRQTDKLVERVLSGPSLEQLFARTAELKDLALRAGQVSPWWPYFDRDETPASDAALPDPYWDIHFDGPATTLDLDNPGYRFMWYPPLDWLDALVHLPRAYLGCAAWLPSWVGDSSTETEKVGRLMSELFQNQSTLIEERNLAARETRIAANSLPQTQAAAGKAEERGLEYRFPSEEGHCWLVIYPAQGHRGLCPMLYWSHGEGGVHVCSLDRHSMHVASQVHLPYEHGIMTLADRVEQLLDDPRRLLATEWARTAFDVQDNPVLACERLDR